METKWEEGSLYFSLDGEDFMVVPCSESYVCSNRKCVLNLYRKVPTGVATTRTGSYKYIGRNKLYMRETTDNARGILNMVFPKAELTYISGGIYSTAYESISEAS